MKAVKSRFSGDRLFYRHGLCGDAALTNHELPPAASTERKAPATVASCEGTVALMLVAGWLPRGLVLQLCHLVRARAEAPPLLETATRFSTSANPSVTLATAGPRSQAV